MRFVDGKICLAVLFLTIVIDSRSNSMDGDEAIIRVEQIIRISFQEEAEGRLDAALRALNLENTTLAFHPIIMYRKGKLMMREGTWNEALSSLTHAATHDPEMPGLFSHAAFVCLSLNDSTNARRAMRAASALDPHDLWIGPLFLLLSYQTLAFPLKPVELAAINKRYQSNFTPSVAEDVVIVTAANSLYFGCVGNMIGSVQRVEPNLPILLYDIGLTDMERAVASSWRGVTLHRFDLSLLPPHVANIRNKAWKPLVRRERAAYNHSLLPSLCPAASARPDAVLA
jgi:hypothetical protein